ncbi:hypothetical protein ABT324_10845 [Saccharopolyspora sp. NPDC000359]|uniref:WXG100 family type VII secretion target n=1 Tax=Saccharopolyspora sp. NPDC000359 TaxID=3154251 RepID=UPI00331A59EE
MNQFYVDPEGLSRSSEGYAKLQSHIHELITNVDQLVNQYSTAFGTTDHGKEAFASFQQGMKGYAQGLRGIADSLEYVELNLKGNGQLYAQARDNADDISASFQKSVAPDADPPGQGESRARELPETTPAGHEPVRTSPRLEVARRLLGKGEPLAVPDPASREHLETRPPGLTSAFSMQPRKATEQLVVDGAPIKEGQRVLALRELPDGSVRFNAGEYSDIVPLDGVDVQFVDQGDPSSTREHPVRDGERLFLVTEKGEGAGPSDEDLYFESTADHTSSFYRHAPG